MNNHRRVMQIPSPRYFLFLDYLTFDGNILNFDDAKYDYNTNEWEYFSVGDKPLGETELFKIITEDEERRVALDYEREEMHKQKLYKKIGIF